ncbi:hypothetical protein TSUD_169060 [Trifolium subterraneum]|nr:hypothetical protein TSUD_169060 [Trifolium subterraneum]
MNPVRALVIIQFKTKPRQRGVIHSENKYTTPFLNILIGIRFYAKVHHQVEGNIATEGGNCDI